MSKAVLISIRPKWVEKIANGKKTIEVRKTKPKLETPFKCYIYCTRDKHLAFMQNQTGTNLIACMDVDAAIPVGGAIGNGKVIGEFTCERIALIAYDGGELSSTTNAAFSPATCLTQSEIIAYIGDKGRCYGWHISDLRIYDTPRELSEFQRATDPCDSCHAEYTWKCTDCKKWGGDIKRPPQSWCYVDDANS
mgnify:FL=1